jgi:hypothetical protein
MNRATEKRPVEARMAHDPVDGLLGQTDCPRHYSRQTNYTPGDLLCDALGVDRGLWIGEAVRAISSEIELVADSIVNGQGKDYDTAIVDEVFHGVCNRLRALAEIDDRARQAQKAYIQQLEAELAAVRPKRLSAKKGHGA